jgi:hypothetical protein
MKSFIDIEKCVDVFESIPQYRDTSTFDEFKYNK